MATGIGLIFGAIVGSSIGGSFLGISAATIGAAIGSSIGGIIDARNANRRSSYDATSWGDPISNIKITDAREGAPIPRIYGRNRISGQVIWQTKYLERLKSTTTGTTTRNEYVYYCSFAIAICEGEIHEIGRIWADGNVMDMSQDTEDGKPVKHQIFYGTEDQLKSSIISGKGDVAPAYRGLAYIVFENLPLSGYGNRIPQLNFEVTRVMGLANTDSMESLCKGISLSGGDLGEFGYASDVVTRNSNRTYGYRTTRVRHTYGIREETGEKYLISSVTESALPYGHYYIEGTEDIPNKVNAKQNSDFTESSAQLEAHLPNADSVILPVAWFGDDLRAGECKITPKTEYRVNHTTLTWRVGNYVRYYDTLTSYDRVGQAIYPKDVTFQDDSAIIAGRLLKGFLGTPADDAVTQAIKALKAQGKKVVFSPKLQMDIRAGNTLRNPYDDNYTEKPGGPTAVLGQPVNPHCSLITCTPAPGRHQTPFGRNYLLTEMRKFFVEYDNFILHYAQLCKDAGGVDTFLLGSGLAGITPLVATQIILSSNSVAGDHLIWLADKVRLILGTGTKISYAANASEWQRSRTGVLDAYYPLDKLWAHSNIDFVGINYHEPLADWRDGKDHLDHRDGRTIHNIDYLQSNIEGGENYDWEYATGTDRQIQTRTTIVDPTTNPAQNKPWVYRTKDIEGWWANAHRVRVYSTDTTVVELSYDTHWIPKSKPIWIMELGCAAIDKGANQPSTAWGASGDKANTIPHFSHGWRDDLAVKSVIEAHMLYWNKSANNPTSGVYGNKMIDTSRIHAGTWDVRPFPYFPKESARWDDSSKWARSTALNGRTGLCSLKAVVADIMDRQKFPKTSYDVSELSGLITGYNLDGVVSAREAIDTLSRSFFFDGIESNGKIVFRHRGGDCKGEIKEQDLIVGEHETPENPTAFSMTRKQESELPRAMKVDYYDEATDFKKAQAYSRRLDTESQKESEISLPFSLEQAQAIGIAEAVLIEHWIARETGSFTLPPSAIKYEPGDVVDAILYDGTPNGKTWPVRIDKISESHARQVEVSRTSGSTYLIKAGPERAYDGRPFIASEMVSDSTSYTTHIIVSVAKGSATLRRVGGTALTFLIAGQQVWGVGIPDNSIISTVATDGNSIVISGNVTISDTRLTVGFGGQVTPVVALPDPPVTYPAVFAVVDHPTLEADSDMQAVRLVAHREPWLAQAFTKEDATTETALRFGSTDSELVSSPTVMGYVTNDVPGVAAYLFIWDRVSKIDVVLHGTGNTVIARPESDILNGHNIAFIEHDTGEWEVVQFVESNLQSDGSFRLTQLLRGLRGTEYLMRNSIGFGSRIVFDNTTPVYVTLPAAELNTAVEYTVQGVGNNSGTTSAHRRDLTLKGAGRRPYSPSQLRMHIKKGTKDLRLSWVRRSRKGGDIWGSAEVPLHESKEQYRVRILSGPSGTVIREQIVTNIAYWDYLEVNQITDFESAQTALTISVSQYGANYGNYGPAQEEQLQIKGTV